MKTSGITTFNSNIDVDVTRNKKRKILESTAILAGSTAFIPASFLIADNFSNNKKNYLKSVKNEKDIFTKTVQKNTDVGVGLLKKIGKPIDDTVIKAIRDQVEITEKTKLEEKLRIRSKKLNNLLADGKDVYDRKEWKYYRKAITEDCPKPYWRNI